MSSDTRFYAIVEPLLIIFKLFSIDHFIFLFGHFHLVMPFWIYSVIMAVSLAPDQAIFDHISLVRIGACFMDNRQECIRWCRQYGLLPTQMVCPPCHRHCREQALDRAVHDVAWRCSVKVCKKRFSIRHGSFF